MGTELVAVKDELHSLARVQAFRDVLQPYKLPLEAWRASFLNVYEQDPGMLKYIDLTSTLNGAMTIAVLGLRMDKATGQSCIVPFKGKAQPIVMVNGFVVVASRAGYTLQGTLIREGEKYAQRAGSNPGIEHEPIVGNKGKVIGVYAVARSNSAPTLFTPILSIDQINETRDRSKGYVSARDNGRPHPWITDFNAMAIKTPKRLLSKDIPNDQLRASNWLETQHDMGKLAWLRQDGEGVTATVDDTTYPARQDGITDVEDLTQSTRPAPNIDWNVGEGREPVVFKDIMIWQQWMLNNIERVSDTTKLQANLERNRPTLLLFEEFWPDAVKVVMGAFRAKGVS